MAEIQFEDFRACALETDATIWCWTNAFGGDVQPTAVDGFGTDVVEIGVGATATYARKSDGSVWLVGSVSFGDLGLRETITSVDTPQQIDTLTNVTQIEAGGNHACALDADGRVWRWGWNRFGEAAPGGAERIWVPAQVTGLTKAMKSISVSSGDSCAISVDGELFCWGDSFGFALGGSAVTPTSATPATAPSGPSASVHVGSLDGCVIHEDGSIRCWGSTWFSDMAPVDVAGPCN